MKRINYYTLFGVCFLLFFYACKKDTPTASTDSIYVPTTTDVTATSTLAELQQGRTLYMNSCGACHMLYSPDSYTSSGWTGILSNMVRRTSLSTADAALVKKYVSRGK